MRCDRGESVYVWTRGGEQSVMVTNKEGKEERMERKRKIAHAGANPIAIWMTQTNPTV